MTSSKKNFFFKVKFLFLVEKHFKVKSKLFCLMIQLISRDNYNFNNIEKK